MKRNRSWLALPALLLAMAAPAAASEVRDKAGLFSADAVRKAQTELDRIERDLKVPVTIETVGSLDGEPIRDVTTRHAEAVHAHGLYIMIAKKEAQIFGEASRGLREYMPRDRFDAIDKAFTADFKAKDFDAGLDKGVAKIGSVLNDARIEAGGSFKSSDPVIRRGAQPARAGRGAVVPGKSSWGIGTLLSIVLGILALFLVIRVIGALFAGNRSGGYSNMNQMRGGPGYGPGGPGYGPGGPGYGGAPAGGGGFMNSMFGGIGGALAGNWLYDQFSGRHGGTVDQSAYDPNVGVAPTESAGPEWGEGGAGASWGGGADDAGGGADWGGDVGGGGGDWGGGGGGDDGASW